VHGRANPDASRLFVLRVRIMVVGRNVFAALELGEQSPVVGITNSTKSGENATVAFAIPFAYGMFP
jgi:hypothetical protein